MNIYYIDYENVTSQGLKGIELLTEEDEVNLLYSKKAETMKIDMLTQLMASRANIRFLPVHVGTPNALDFQLITLLFLHYTEGNRYFIISKDSGYDCCIKTAIENNAPNVFRFPNIESAVNGGQKQRSQRSRRGSGRNSQNHSQTAAVPIQAQEQNMVQEQDLNAAQEQGLNVTQEQDLNAAYMQEADVMQPQSTDSAKDAGAMPNHDPITAQTQKADNAQSQDLNDLDVQAADNAPVQSQDVEEDHDEAADEGHASSEDSGRKRNSRRRGRRKSSSASQTEAASAEKAADARNDVAEENHEEPGQTKANRSQKQSRQTKDSQKQAQQGRDNQNQRQPQQNRDNQSQKPVTILSVIRRRNDVQLDLSQIDLIRDALKNTSNKQQFYNFFAKKLGQKKGIELYHSIKSSYTDLINANLV